MTNPALVWRKQSKKDNKAELLPARLWGNAGKAELRIPLTAGKLAMCLTLDVVWVFFLKLD